MATRKIKDAKDLSTNELIYFRGHAQATYMSDGTSVEDKINSIQTGDVDLTNYYTKDEINSNGYITGESFIGEDLDDVEIVGSQVQADWNETDENSKSYIKNKPEIPTSITESTVTNWGFTKNTGTYNKPSTGIPKTDLDVAIQTSLEKADTALQSYVEQYQGTITEIKMNGISKGTSGVVDLGNIITDHQDISGKQDKLISGINIKTINGESILGNGDIVIEGSTLLGNIQKPVIKINDNTVSISPNIYYIIEVVFDSLLINLEPPTNDELLNEYVIEFTTSENNTQISLPNSIKWSGGNIPVFENNTTYQISIINNLGIWVKFV